MVGTPFIIGNWYSEYWLYFYTVVSDRYVLFAQMYYEIQCTSYVTYIKCWLHSEYKANKRPLRQCCVHLGKLLVFIKKFCKYECYRIHLSTKVVWWSLICCVRIYWYFLDLTLNLLHNTFILFGLSLSSGLSACPLLR